MTLIQGYFYALGGILLFFITLIREYAKPVYHFVMETIFWIFLGVSLLTLLVLCAFGFTTHHLLKLVDSHS